MTCSWTQETKEPCRYSKPISNGSHGNRLALGKCTVIAWLHCTGCRGSHLDKAGEVPHAALYTTATATTATVRLTLSTPAKSAHPPSNIPSCVQPCSFWPEPCPDLQLVVPGQCLSRWQCCNAQRDTCTTMQECPDMSSDTLDTGSCLAALVGQWGSS